MAYLKEFLYESPPKTTHISTKVHESDKHPATIRELAFPTIKQEAETPPRKFTAFTIENILADKREFHATPVEDLNSDHSSLSRNPSPASSTSSIEAKPAKERNIPRPRYNRTSFSDLQLMILESMFQMAPYPSNVVKQKLATRLQVSELTIVNWFKKRRTWWRQGDKKMIHNIARVTRQAPIHVQDPFQLSGLHMTAPNYHETNFHFNPFEEAQINQTHVDWSAGAAFSSHPSSAFSSYHSQSSRQKQRSESSQRRYHPYSQREVSNPAPYGSFDVRQINSYRH